MSPEKLLDLIEFYASAHGCDVVAHIHGDAEGSARFEADTKNALAKIREEIERQAADRATMRHGYEINQASLLAKLAEVRTTGKRRVSDGVERRNWTHEQWLSETHAIFNGPFGGAGDLLNGHVSAMFRELNDAGRGRCYHCGAFSKGNPKCPVCRPYDPAADAKELPFRQVPAAEVPE